MKEKKCSTFVGWISLVLGTVWCMCLLPGQAMSAESIDPDVDKILMSMSM